jgi:protein-L-isoaspartate(D-aspartate) O-methyltransferase
MLKSSIPCRSGRLIHRPPADTLGQVRKYAALAQCQRANVVNARSAHGGRNRILLGSGGRIRAVEEVAMASAKSASEPSPPEQMMFQLTLRRRGISDQAVLRAMEAIPRDAFVEPADRAAAWHDTALGIACGQTISQPFVVAYMTEQLQLRATHRVLEIGTGSGYQAAILSRLARDVVSIERYRTLADRARQRLKELHCDNVEVRFGDGFDLPAEAGTFDRIIVTAAMESIPPELIERLEPDGILLAPVGPHSGAQTLTRLHSTAAGIETKQLVAVRFVPALPGVAREL